MPILVPERCVRTGLMSVHIGCTIRFSKGVTPRSGASSRRGHGKPCVSASEGHGFPWPCLKTSGRVLYVCQIDAKLGFLGTCQAATLRRRKGVKVRDLADQRVLFQCFFDSCAISFTGCHSKRSLHLWRRWHMIEKALKQISLLNGSKPRNGYRKNCKKATFVELVAASVETRLQMATTGTARSESPGDGRVEAQYQDGHRVAERAIEPAHVHV